MERDDRLVRRYLHGLVTNKIGQNLWLEPNVIPDGESRRIYEKILGLLNRGSEMTPEVVIDALAMATDEFDAEEFVRSAHESNTTPAQVREIHNVLMDRFVKNRACLTLKQLSKDIDKPGSIDMALESIRRLKAMQPTKSVNLGRQTSSAVKEAINGIEYLIPYGISRLDRRLGGATRGEIAILAARPGHGKTSFSNQLVLNWISKNKKVIFFSLEMPTAKLIHKMLSNVARIDGQKIRNGEFTDEERARFVKAAEGFVERFSTNFLIYDDVTTTQEMETLIAKHKPDVVVVDFIQLMHMDQSSMRLELFRIMRTFKFVAKEYNCAFLVLSQLNRSLENREDPRPRLSDLAESGALEQLAADVLFLYYEHKVDHNASPYRVDLYATKTRYGEPGKVKLAFEGRYMRYSQIDDPNAPQQEENDGGVENVAAGAEPQAAD